MNNQDKNQDIELKTNTPQADTMFILDQLDLMEHSESIDVPDVTNNTNATISSPNTYDNIIMNVSESDKEDEKDNTNKENVEEEDVRVLAYLQCKSLESYTHTELDKHLKKQHNVVFDKGGYINLYTKMFLAECRTCGAAWNMYSVDSPSTANFNVDALGKISHVTPYKGYSVHSNLHKTDNDQKKGWDKWWDRNSGLQDKINYHPKYTENTNSSNTPHTIHTSSTKISDTKQNIKVI